MASAAGARRSAVRPSDALRAAGISALAARALLTRVRQSAARVVLDQRFRAGDSPRLHRPGAQERVRDPLLVRRHDRILGRRQTGHEHQISPACRLHALVADDEQPVRVGRNVAAQEVSRRCRAARSASDLLRSLRLRQTRQRRLRVPPRQGSRSGRPSCPALGVRDSNNDVFDKGTTTSRLPGESGFKDARGSTLFPDLPGQSRDPIYNTTLPGGKESK